MATCRAIVLVGFVSCAGVVGELQGHEDEGWTTPHRLYLHTPRTDLELERDDEGRLPSSLIALRHFRGTVLGRVETGELVLGYASLEELSEARRLDPLEGFEFAKPPSEAAIAERFDRYIIHYSEKAKRPEELIESTGWKVKQIDHSLRIMLGIASKPLDAATLDRLIEREAIEFLEPSLKFKAEGTSTRDGVATTGKSIAPAPNDPDYCSQTALTSIRAPEAWKSVTKSEIVIAVLDGGLPLCHDDLKHNLWKNSKEIPADAKDSDGNGYVDDYRGYDFVDDDADPSIVMGHGMLASIIGAEGNNGRFVCGCCWSCQIMVIRVMDPKDDVDMFAAARGINYAVSNGARVINASWGTYTTEQGNRAVRRAIARAHQAGVLLVCSAGNLNCDTDTTRHYPSVWPMENIVSVMALDEFESKYTDSNYGATTVDIAAPGESVLTLHEGGQFLKSMSGTSAAAPHVAAALALTWSHPSHKNKDWKSIRKLVMEHARELPSLCGKCVTNGTLDLTFLAK